MTQWTDVEYCSLSVAEKLDAYGPGPWLDEPDCEAGQFYEMKYLIVRNVSLGHFCGYVVVPSSHPWYGKHYDKIDADVHQGLTYAGELAVHGESFWRVGFDCGHCNDLAPGLEHRKREFLDHVEENPELEFLKKAGEQIDEWREKFPHSMVFQKSYKTIEFVRSHCKSLAHQAFEAADG